MHITWWIVFNLFVLVVLALDLGVFHRKSHEVSIKEALVWSTIWTILALVFNAWIYFWRGKATALAFFSGYLIERSLSIDNIFVFYVIFSYFAVPAAYQHKVLFWGIISALIMRGGFIALGITLINKFEWIIYVFGLFLIATGIRMAVSSEKEVHPERNPVLKVVRRLWCTTEKYQGSHFFVRQDGRPCMTPLFVVLLIIETSDVLFAVDSIPAILAITTDPFIVYTSNVFAILGLRALYFALAGATAIFEYIHYGLALILVLVGIKMLISHFYEVPIGWFLLLICAILGASMAVSVAKAKQPHEQT